MSVQIIDLQYDEIINKLNNLLNTVADKTTQQQIQQLINDIKSLMSKESKQDNIISQLTTLASKIDQIMNLLGAPKPTYTVSVLTSSVGANKHHLALFNNNPNLKVVIKRITLNAEITTTITGFQLSFRVQKISAVSGGTSVAIMKFDKNDPDLTGITAVSNPTSATVSGTLDTITINFEETGGDVARDRYYGLAGEKPITLYNGEGISIQQYGTAGTGNLTATVVFTVE